MIRAELSSVVAPVTALIPAEWVGPLIGLLGLVVVGIFAIIARKGAERLPPAVAYDAMWRRLAEQDTKIEELRVSQRTMGDGFDALYNANARSSSPLTFTENEQHSVDAARRLRTGEENLVG